MNKNLIKVFSSMTLMFFLSTNVRAEMPVSGGLLTAGQERPGFLQVEIPSELASVEDVFEAPSKDNPQMILHIQNIHGNYESQVQISRLLSYLYEKYGFKLLFAEGAADKLNPELMRFFPDAERNKKLADLMARNGELTGIEYYLIDGPKDVEAVGIEEAALYRQNYEAFKTVYRQKAEIDRFLSLYEARLENLGSRIFSPNTRKMLGDWKKFEAGHRDFLPYVKQLCAEAKTVLNLDLESLFAQVEWPQITRLIALQSMEKDLDRKAAEKDKQRLLTFLKEQQVSAEMIKAIETLDEKKITMSSSEAERRKEDLPRFLFERLVDEAGPKGFKFHDYPAFSLWAGHLILQNELDSKLLFEEIEKVFTKILSELTVTEREKDLLEIWKDEILLRKLMHLEVVRKEWERAVYRKEWVSLDSMVNRLKKISADAGTGAELSAGDWAELQSLAGNGNSADKNSLQAALQTSYDFYDFARQRESVFFDIIKKTMAEKQTNKAVLVTGGFHTDGLMEMFRENEINASVLMPRITGEIDNSGYVSTMLENKPSILEFKTQTLEVVARALPGFVQMEQGRTPEGIISSTLEYVAQVDKTQLTLDQIRETVQRIAAQYYLGATSVEKIDGKFVVRLNMNMIGFPLSPVNNGKTVSEILAARGIKPSDVDSVTYVSVDGGRRTVPQADWETVKVEVPSSLPEHDWYKVQLQVTFRSEMRINRRLFLRGALLSVAAVSTAGAGEDEEIVTAPNPKNDRRAQLIWAYAQNKLKGLESKFAEAFKEKDASDKILLSASDWKEQIDLRAEVMKFLQQLAGTPFDSSHEPLNAQEVGKIAKALGEFSLKEAARLGAQTTGVRGGALKNPANELRRSYLEGLVKLSLGSQELQKIFNKSGKLEFDLSSPLFFDLKPGFDPAAAEKDMTRYGEVVYTIAVLMGVEKVYSVDEVNQDFSTALARVWASRDQTVTLAKVAAYFSLVKFVNTNADTMTLDVMARRYSDAGTVTPKAKAMLREALREEMGIQESQTDLDKRLIYMAASSALINEILTRLPNKNSDLEEVPTPKSADFFYKLTDANTLDDFKQALKSEGISPLLLSYSVSAVRGKGALEALFNELKPLGAKDLFKFREVLKSYSLQHINPGVMGWQRDELEKTYSEWKREVSAARMPTEVQAANSKLERKILEFHHAALTDLIHRNPKIIQNPNNFSDIVLGLLRDNEFNRLWIMANHLEYLEFMKPLIMKNPGLVGDLQKILDKPFDYIDNTISVEERRAEWKKKVVDEISGFLSSLNGKKTPGAKRSEVRVSVQDGTVAMELGGVTVAASENGLVVNGVALSLSEAKTALSRAATNRAEAVTEAQRQLDALENITPEVRGFAQDALTAMAGASRSRIVIPGQEENNDRTGVIESASPVTIPVGYPVFQMAVTPQGLGIPQPILSVAAVAGGLLTNLDELNSLARALGNLQNPASSTLNAALLEGTLLAPTAQKLRMMAVINVADLNKQGLEQLNNFIASVLVPFSNTTVKVVIVGSSVSALDIKLSEKLQTLVGGRISLEKISKLSQLERVRTQFVHPKGGGKINSNEYLEIHFSDSETTLGELYTEQERTYALVLERAGNRVEIMQKALTVGFAVLAERLKELKEAPGLFKRKIGFNVTFINQKELNALNAIVEALAALRSVSASA